MNSAYFPMLKRMGFYMRATAMLAIVGVYATAQGATDFPNKPVKLIVPFPAGSVTDTQMRALTRAAAIKLGQPIVIENKAGATGSLGATTLVNLPGDGYTLSAMPSAITGLLHQQQVNYDPSKDFTYIIGLSAYNFGFVVRTGSPYENLEAFIEDARSRPGKINYATSGVGGGGHLSMEQFQTCKGIRLNHIPFKGGADATAAFMGGHLDSQADGAWAQLVEGGKGRLLMVLTPRRIAEFPNVPTLKDVCPNVAVDGQQMGIAGPKGMDPAVVKKIHDALRDSMDDPAFLAALKLAKQDLSYMSGQEYGDWMKLQQREKGVLIKSLGLHKDK